MENNPNKVKDKDYYLNSLKNEILKITKNGEDSNNVFLHNDYELDSKGHLVTIAKYFNPIYNAEKGEFSINRLIPTPGRSEFASRLEYSFHENSDIIYCKQCRWDGHLDGQLPVREKTYSTAEEVEYVSRCISDGLRLSEQEATKVLRKHRIRLKSDYGIDNGDIPPSLMKRLIDKIIHDIDE
jgi:hypothetical protein